MLSVIETINTTCLLYTSYGEILHSLQPVYGLTGGLSNKTVTKMIHQLLKNLPMYSEFLPEEIRERYQPVSYTHLDVYKRQVSY